MAVVAAAALRPLLRRPVLGHLRQYSAAPAPPSAAEDFDLIEQQQGLARVDGLDDAGFLVQGMRLNGAVMLSGTLQALWRVAGWSDVTAESLALLRLIKPAPDLLVLGCGRTLQRRLPAALGQQLQGMGIRTEVLDTANAVALFNLLNQEGRSVVGALLPLGTSLGSSTEEPLQT